MRPEHAHNAQSLEQACAIRNSLFIDFLRNLLNQTLLKSNLFKNILAKSNSLVNLHDSTPHFGACLPSISVQNRENLLCYKAPNGVCAF